jgi:group I intron endonuclease
MGYIYMFTSPSGKSYIGQTIRTIEERFGEHRTGRSSKCVLMYRAMQKYGWESFEKDWYECPDEDLNKHEELMIEVLGTLSPGGYNLKEGGANGKLSEETKQKISVSNTGKIRTSESKLKMSEAQRGENHPLYGMTGEKHPMFGKKHTEETKEKMREAHLGDKNYFYGKSHTDKTKQKISEANKGKTHSEETKQRMSESRFGTIRSDETKQKIRESHIGMTHTEESKQKISEARMGDKNHWYGKFHSEETKQKMKEAQLGEKHHSSRKVYQYELDGTFIRSFASSGEATRYLDKKSSSTIRRCARGDQETAHGFKWSHTKY